MLKVDGLCKRLGKAFGLEGVTFSVEPGEILAVLGPNGSGKSTVLRLLAGLTAPSGGSIRWKGEKLSEGDRVIVPPELRSVGLLLQEGVLFPHLRVRENVALGLAPETPREAADQLVGEALEAAHVGHLAGARIQRLSGGEVQRVALARALAQRPAVMLLDEPFHSLDGLVKVAIIAEIRSLVSERGLAAVLVTHDAEEASALADRVMLLREGRKVQEGSLEEIYRAPVDSWAARFLGEVASIDRDVARASSISLPEGADGPTIWLRPEALILDPSPGEGLEITAVRRRRGFTDVTVALPGGAPLVSRAPGDAAWAVGRRVRARVAWALPSSLHGEHPS